MSTTAIPTNTKWWNGGRSPFNASYGKVMMWYFLMSDAFTFGAFLISYGTLRFSQNHWVDPNHVFNSFPFAGHADLPLAFVSIMTFILIISSVTMVMAVHKGHQMDQKGVEKYMLWTIVGGAAFLGCQAWEWTHLLTGEHAVLVNGQIEHWNTTVSHNPFGPEVMFNGQEVATPGPIAFGSYFFEITGFHGFHVLSGVVINIIMYIKTKMGHFQQRGHYEMIEKAGLYWHFVDLVWVFVFLCFYLI
ncbi:MAG: cytochrome c oxidase subunit 3 [Ferruginibacter sp.]|jgi:cytochrome c oxidase subunit 3